jgi:hypothetical protein
MPNRRRQADSPRALSDLESERRATADFKPAPELFGIANPEQRGVKSCHSLIEKLL